jgi:hypothetical protein
LGAEGIQRVEEVVENISSKLSESETFDLRVSTVVHRGILMLTNPKRARKTGSTKDAVSKDMSVKFLEDTELDETE